jgi:hypothetical protein
MCYVPIAERLGILLVGRCIMGVDLAYKKELVLRYLPLGMSLEDAMFYSEMTEDEIELCDVDETFQRKVRFKALAEEERLLNMFDGAMNNNAREGKTGDIRYKLGMMNPKRYGDLSQKASLGVDNGGLGLNINITSKSSSLKQENVEINEAGTKAQEDKANALGIEDAATGL